MEKLNLNIGKLCITTVGTAVMVITFNACNSTPEPRQAQPLAQAKVVYVVHQYQAAEPVMQTAEPKYRAPGVWPGRAPGSTEVTELPDTYTEPPKSDVVILRYKTNVGATSAYPVVGGGAPLPVSGGGRYYSDTGGSSSSGKTVYKTYNDYDTYYETYNYYDVDYNYRGYRNHNNNRPKPPPSDNGRPGFNNPSPYKSSGGAFNKPGPATGFNKSNASSGGFNSNKSTSGYNNPGPSSGYNKPSPRPGPPEGNKPGPPGGNRPGPGIGKPGPPGGGNKPNPGAVKPAPTTVKSQGGKAVSAPPGKTPTFSPVKQLPGGMP